MTPQERGIKRLASENSDDVPDQEGGEPDQQHECRGTQPEAQERLGLLGEVQPRCWRAHAWDCRPWDYRRRLPGSARPSRRNQAVGLCACCHSPLARPFSRELTLFI